MPILVDMDRRTFITASGLTVAASALGATVWPEITEATEGAEATESATAAVAPKHFVIGHSTKGRPIKAYLLGNRDAPNRYLVLGQMHGDEGAGRLLTHDRLINKDPVKGVALWVVPTMNPDGSIRNTRTNARGVDLNRNFPSKTWVRQGKGTHYYSGPRPASEPETRAILRFFSRIQPRTIVSLHQPLACVDFSGGSKAVTQWLSHHLHLPVSHIHISGGGSSSGGGTMTSWFNAKYPKKTAVTVELPRSTSPEYRNFVAEVLHKHAHQRRT
jgi:murein tripeptide amidase MpaA